MPELKIISKFNNLLFFLTAEVYKNNIRVSSEELT